MIQSDKEQEIWLVLSIQDTVLYYCGWIYIYKIAVRVVVVPIPKKDVFVWTKFGGWWMAWPASNKYVL